MSETAKLALNVAAVLVIVSVLVRLLFLEQVTVRDNGMAPTLVYGDEVLVFCANNYLGLASDPRVIQES